MAVRKETAPRITDLSLSPIVHDASTLSRWHRWLNDPDIRAVMYDNLPSTQEDIDYWLELITTDPDRHYFSIEADGTPVGFVSLRRDKQPNNTGEIGIIIGEKAHQEKRIGTHVLAALLDYARDEVGLSSVRAMIKPDNTKSIRLFSGAGFKAVRPETIHGTPMIRFEKELITR